MLPSRIGICCLAYRKIDISARRVVNVHDAGYGRALVSTLPLCNKPAEIETWRIGMLELSNETNVATTVAPVWTAEAAWSAYRLPFNDLLFKAQSVHRQHFDPNRVQLSKLLNIKTGGCPEDCGYCSQSVHNSTGLAASKLMDIEKIVAEARKAKEAGATRYCMGAAWRNPKPRDMDAIVEVVGAVKALGLETCMTLGMLDREQSDRLNAAGLDYYNHNIDTSERYYPQVTSTRTFSDRLDTLDNVRQSGMKVCCGGILGMGEEEADRVDMLVTLANLPEPPESVPINMLIPIADHDAEITCSPVGRSLGHDRRDAGALLFCGGEFDLCRRNLADRRQSGKRGGHEAFQSAGITAGLKSVAPAGYPG
jgi:biotin synthase